MISRNTPPYPFVHAVEKMFLLNDIRMAMNAMINARMGTGDVHRNADADADPFAQLNQLYGMERVRRKLKQLQNTYIVAKRDGEDQSPLGHFIFTGSPGTGKTSGQYRNLQ